MTSVWDLSDFDAHESVHLFDDPASGLRAIIALHSMALGPAAGGTRFWHYADDSAALTDALRLSRGMSYKNAMAGLPAGGGKAVILAPGNSSKTPAMLTAFARAVESLGGQYITAQDVGMSEADMVALAPHTRHVAGLPGAGGGDPGPATARGVHLAVKAAAHHALGTDSMRQVHVAIQGVGSVGSGLARLLAADGARLTIADVDTKRAAKLADELGATIVAADKITTVEANVFAPCALGKVLNAASIAALRVAAVAGGANNQLETDEDGDRLAARGIVYAPDYVANAGGIINVLRHLDGSGDAAVDARIAQIPARLAAIWAQSSVTGMAANRVADRMAQRLIGRG